MVATHSFFILKYFQTFEGLRRAGRATFVRMQLERQLSVGLLQIVLIRFFGNAEYLVIIFAFAYAQHHLDLMFRV